MKLTIYSTKQEPIRQVAFEIKDTSLWDRLKILFTGRLFHIFPLYFNEWIKQQEAKNGNIKQ